MCLSSPATELSSPLQAAGFLFTLHRRLTGLGSAPLREGQFLMPVGTVKFFNGVKGFGFITPDGGGKDDFVHVAAVASAGWATLKQRQRIKYDLVADERGKDSAVNLRHLLR
jgi:CspA family cold shock protein